MHELSVAESIMDIVRQYVKREEESSVKTINVRLGELSGVVADSLVFCFSAITADSELRNAALHIEHIPFQLHCNQCQRDVCGASGLAVCPECHGTDTNILSGTELQVTDIELNGESTERA